MKKNKKEILLTSLALISVIVITVGVTFAFFNYTKEGTTDNTVTTGSITFLYTETSGVGKGISLTDAFPISDEVGKNQVGEGKVFDFKVTSASPNKTAIPYEITARKKSDSSLDESAVKLYLTKVNSGIEEEVLLSKYSNLTPTTKVDSAKYTEKTIYQGKVPANSTNYEQAFKLRMWIDEETNFSPNEDGTYPYNGKTFTVTVNVYANAKIVTEEDIALESNANISSIIVDGVEATAVSGQDYDYETALPGGTTSTKINIETENPYATVNVERLDSLAYSSNIKRLSTSKTLELIPGDNYFKITVNSENKEVTSEYKIKISIDSSILKSNSILGALANDNLISGYYNILVNNEIYPVHLYVLEGNQTFSEDKKFGDENDVGTADSYAKNMVIVKVNGDLTINEGVTVEPYYTEYGGPKGFTLYVDGTLTNNGTIDNSHGAYAEGQNVYLYKNSDGSYETVPAIGAVGAQTYGTSGNSGEGRQTGGGGSGWVWVSNGATGSGGTGTSYSGGTGSGGGDKGTGAAGSSYGGAGGDGAGSGGGAGGGAGNPGGIGTGNGKKGENGTGGLLVIYVNILNNNGNITANGSLGGSGNHGGGASGGGSINIFSNSNSNNIGNIYANGDGIGGNGTVSIGNISTGVYINTLYNFDYTERIEKFTVPQSGNYKLETWGAQGGSFDTTYHGGYGGYSVGNVYLNKGKIIYIVVGGKGNGNVNTDSGGYNGGGASTGCVSRYRYSGSGGGATHIAVDEIGDGQLKNYSNDADQEKILIVSGGGGGAFYMSVSGNGSLGIGGSSGGYVGNDAYFSNIGNHQVYMYAKGGSQLSGGSSGNSYLNNTINSGVFGQGSSMSFNTCSGQDGSGGGAGYYGGGGGFLSSAAGGSSYIGNSLLTSKAMYCYNCEENDGSENSSYKTISTTGNDKDSLNCPNGYSNNPVSKCAKSGNGYARITYLGN